MAKKADDDLQKHTLNLYAGDLDELASLFPDIPKSVVVRELVRSTINRHRAAAPPPANLQKELSL